MVSSVPKRVLEIGNCGPDHHTFSQLVDQHFDAIVDPAHQEVDARKLLDERTYALVVVNRLLDIDGSSGLEVIRNLKQSHPDLPVMMITNFADHQETAVSNGAEPGFGKNSLGDASTLDLLKKFLS